MAQTGNPSIEFLVRNANQIAAFFQREPADKAAAGVAEHIGQFWTAAMRDRLEDLASHEPQRLRPAVIAGLRMVRSAVHGRRELASA